MIVLKSKREIELMRIAGQIVAETHDVLRGLVKPGITTQELDAVAESTIRKLGGEPAFKGYGGFRRVYVLLSTMKWFMGFQEKTS